MWKLSLLLSTPLLAAGPTSAQDDFVWALEDECEQHASRTAQRP